MIKCIDDILKIKTDDKTKKDMAKEKEKETGKRRWKRMAATERQLGKRPEDML